MLRSLRNERAGVVAVEVERPIHPGVGLIGGELDVHVCRRCVLDEDVGCVGPDVGLVDPCVQDGVVATDGACVGGPERVAVVLQAVAQLGCAGREPTPAKVCTWTLGCAVASP